MMQVDLAHHSSLQRWQPKVGDFLIWHGWFQHWFGVICNVSPSSEITIIYKGMPVLLFALTQSEYEKNKRTIHLSDVVNNSFWKGKYAAISSTNGTIIWYV